VGSVLSFIFFPSHHAPFFLLDDFTNRDLDFFLKEGSPGYMIPETITLSLLGVGKNKVTLLLMGAAPLRLQCKEP
jgi:hypothetical protein